MNRHARVVAQGDHSVTLQLQEQKKCAACPGNCNKPLFNLFSMNKNLFTLNKQHSKYQIIDQGGLLSKKLTVGYPLVIQISEQELFQFSGLLYLMPLILSVACLTFGHYLGKWLGASTDLISLLGLMAGMFLAYLSIRSNFFTRHLKFRPKVTILDSNGTNA